VPLVPRFTPQDERSRAYERVLEHLQAYFEHFRNLGGGRLR
jgi:hypothetical protein